MKKILLFSSILISISTTKAMFLDGIYIPLKPASVTPKEYKTLAQNRKQFYNSNNPKLLSFTIDHYEILLSCSKGKPSLGKYLEEYLELILKKKRIKDDLEDYKNKMEEIRQLSQSNQVKNLNQAINFLDELINREIYPRKYPQLYLQKLRLKNDVRKLSK
jgi:hypothetical protein